MRLVDDFLLDDVQFAVNVMMLLFVQAAVVAVDRLDD